MKLKSTLLAALFAAAALIPITAPAEQITLMTGPQGGVWVPLGGALKGMWEKAVPGLQVQMQPGAGIANIRGVDEGKAQIGFGNTITTVDGLAGRPPYPKKITKVCQVANLYPQYYQVVVPVDANINSIADMKGKVMVTQPKGNTAEIINVHMLQVHGMTYQSLAKVNFINSYTDAVEMMKDGHAQVFTLGTAVPASAVMDLASARDIKLIGIDAKDTGRHEEDQPGLLQAHHQGRHLSEAEQGRRRDRLCHPYRLLLRPAGRDGLQDDQGDGRQRQRHGGIEQVDQRLDAEDHGRGHRRTLPQGRPEILQGSGGAVSQGYPRNPAVLSRGGPGRPVFTSEVRRL